MKPFIIFERLLAVSIIVWLVWLFTYNPDGADSLDLLSCSLTVYLLAATYWQRKKILIGESELKKCGSTWVLLLNVFGFMLALYFLPEKIPSDDISARLMLWLFFITYLYDIGLRLKAWRILGQMNH